MIEITPVIVTRGDSPKIVSRIVESIVMHTTRLGYCFFHPTIIYDNSQRLDFHVFSRYIAAESATTDYVYVQDDDCLVDLSAFPLSQISPDHVLTNMPADYRPNYPSEIQLVGFGAVFHRSLIRRTFERFFTTDGGFDDDYVFLVECDRVFTGLNKCELVDVPITHLPNAMSPHRLYRQSDHGTRRRAIETRIKRCLEGGDK